MCGLFVEVEAKSFDRRLEDVLPLLFEIIKPENYDKQVLFGKLIIVSQRIKKIIQKKRRFEEATSLGMEN